MKTITLVIFNDQEEKRSWDYGAFYAIAYTTESLLEIREAVLNQKSDYILFWDAQNPLPSYEDLLKVTQEKGNMWHVGTALGNQSIPKLLAMVQPTSMLHWIADSAIDHSSWKCSFKGCLLVKEVFQDIPIDTYSNSLDLMALDFGYTAMKSGVIPRFSKRLSKEVSPLKYTSVKAKEELGFIKRNLDTKAFIWCYFLSFLKISPLRFIQLFKLKKKKEILFQYPNSNKGTFDLKKKISIVIATLNRYQVLQEELLEIQKLSPSVDEIVIVDQTPKNERNPSFLEPFKELPITYLEVDRIGQCSARNIGYKAATGDYIWFLDDDMKEFPKDYLKRHLETLAKYDADISCGVPDETGTDFIKREPYKAFLSDGFPTNDVLLKKELLEEVDGFDEKMDQLQSEDQEIGLRLIKKGALSIKNTKLRLLHLRAPMGGLRTHKVRKVTFSASRKSILKRRLLHYSEIYLSKKHFSKKNIFYLLLLNIRGTFIVRGGILKKALKILFGLLMLIPTIFVITNRNSLAKKMIQK
jgi:GT2 family glycosyltransferase